MNELKIRLNKSIEMLNELMKYVEDNELTNSQEVISWLDQINEISVKH